MARRGSCRIRETRGWVEDVGDSRDLGDRLHEQIMLGGGLFAKGKCLVAESIPDETPNPLETLILVEEAELMQLEEMYSLPAFAQTPRNPEIQLKFWSPEKRRDFIRKISFRQPVRNHFGRVVEIR